MSNVEVITIYHYEKAGAPFLASQDALEVMGVSQWVSESVTNR